MCKAHNSLTENAPRTIKRLFDIILNIYATHVSEVISSENALKLSGNILYLY